MKWNTTRPFHVKQEFLSPLISIDYFFLAWKESTLEEKKSIIQQATDYLDLLEEDKRTFSAKAIVYISLGKMK